LRVAGTTRKKMSRPVLFAASLLLVLSGCASTSDIDLSKVESACGQQCAASYSECLGKFTLFPIQAQHQCTDALRLCAQTCPPRKAQSVVTAPAS
jgi:hypothetical protein